MELYLRLLPRPQRPVRHGHRRGSPLHERTQQRDRSGGAAHHVLRGGAGLPGAGVYPRLRDVDGRGLPGLRASEHDGRQHRLHHHQGGPGGELCHRLPAAGVPRPAVFLCPPARSVRGGFPSEVPPAGGGAAPLSGGVLRPRCGSHPAGAELHRHRRPAHAVPPWR